jgi:AmmeMemoRadiSam system protein B
VAQLRNEGLPVDNSLHAAEHSIENQLPFLQAIHGALAEASVGQTRPRDERACVPVPADRGRLKIVPVGVGALSWSEASALAQRLANFVRSRGLLLLGTTDLSHEGPAYRPNDHADMTMEEATALTREKDAALLDAIARHDARALDALGRVDGCSACGIGAAVVTLLTCRALGLTRAERLRYLVNTEVTPAGSTTGFAAFAFRPCAK